MHKCDAIKTINAFGDAYSHHLANNYTFVRPLQRRGKGVTVNNETVVRLRAVFTTQHRAVWKKLSGVALISEQDLILLC